jgi:hypothetical protein
VDLDPQKVAYTVENYLGKPWGRLFVKAVIVCGALGIISVGLDLFLRQLVGQVVWPFISHFLGVAEHGVTVDNIAAVIVTLAVSLVILTVIFIAVVVIIAGALRRRSVPQYAIDDLAEFRSTAIHILNDVPKNQSDLQRWEKGWHDWRQTVVNYLDLHFTKAESLSFQRLGLIAGHNFGMAINPKHNHDLMMLAKQIVILEDMIQRHLERS